ncbi:threonine/serine ThrE exporter family protein [Corynebacterium aquilae]|uniref:Membrane protein n=1 Tax=Corynebacterium aquilae DSM 44791 TaxID=1431546 RepID=A0A1L7CI05_9CORY|nr:threonine/serine exporter family protein [Corynebacterium aquilae]APT85481.1 membrane protein [Corynebacterium aquilae DSM 44791]
MRDTDESDFHAQFEMGVEADAVLRLGLLLMGAGTSGYRVMRAMKRAARALGFTRLDIVVSVNTITCTFHRGKEFRTVVANQHDPTVDASRIEAIEDLAHHLHRRISAAELNARLDEIEHNVTRRWSPWLVAFAAGVACAAFALLNHYPPKESAGIFLAAVCGQATRGFLARRHFNTPGVVALSALVACAVYYLMSGVVELASGYVAAVLFVIPGFPLFSALLDLIRFDITAGLSRLAYALVIMTAATLSVSVFGMITGMPPLPEVHEELPWPVLLLASLVGIAGFAVLFNSSRRMILIASLVGGAANMVRIIAIANYDAPPQLAAFLSGVLIGLMAALIARPARLPRITMTVPAAVIMVPGAAMYQATYALNNHDIDTALASATTAALIVVYISAGLAVARMLTDKDWALGRLIDFNRPLDGEAQLGR